jgi:hypothetical protein
MAIGPDGKVTTTGMMGVKPTTPQAPNLSALGTGQKQAQPAQQPTPEPESDLKKQFPDATDMELEFAERVKSLTDEDTAALQSVLSPSVRTALGKIIPEFKEIMDAYGSNEANVVIPVSIASKYAMAKYNTPNPEEALQSMTTELLAVSDLQPMGEQPMEQQQQTTVPPSQPQGIMTSPQNMEQV